MTSSNVEASVGVDGPYFFLSHAHTTGFELADDPDYWVKEVFQDLSEEVAKLPRLNTDWELGLFRPCAASNADVDELVHRALTTAGVFVALHSEVYLDDPDVQRQQSIFVRQQPSVSGRPSHERILPVIWDPPPDAASSPGFDDAIAMGPAVPDYAEIGLLALCRLAPARDTYRHVLAFLSQWITNVVDGRQPPRGRGRSDVRSARTKSVSEFVIGVLDLPADANPLQSIAQQIAGFVDRGRFDVRIVHVRPGEERFATCPGLLLVDPRSTDTEIGQIELRAAVESLQAWVVVISVDDDPLHTDRVALTRLGVRMLAETVPSLRPRMLSDPDEFGGGAAKAVAEACKRYEITHPKPDVLRPFRSRDRMIDAISEAE